MGHAVRLLIRSTFIEFPGGLPGLECQKCLRALQRGRASSGHARIRALLTLALAVLASALAPAALAQQLLYVHTDHLNTPRLVTNGAGVAMWRWDQIEPFGGNPPDEDSDGNGAPGHMPLRFPGQYYDKESNFHYNYFRDCYDTTIGRYCQSDPIGLRSGINLYEYARSNPLLYTDPTGENPFLVCLAIAGAAATAYGGYNLYQALNNFGQSAQQYGNSALQCSQQTDPNSCSQALSNQAQMYGNAANAGAAGAGMGRGFPPSKGGSPTSAAPPGNQPRYPTFPSNASNSTIYQQGYNR